MIIKKRQLFVDAPYIVSKGNSQGKLTDQSQKIVESIITEAEERAQKIILGAKDQANEIVENAKKESKRIIEEAQKRAEEIQKQIDRYYKQASVILSKFEEKLNSNLNEIAEELSDIVALLVEKITYRELDRVDLERKIHDILKKIVGMKSVKVTMNLIDFDQHKSLVEELESLGVEVNRSAELKQGEIIVDTEIGVINGTKQKARELVEQLVEEVFWSE